MEETQAHKNHIFCQSFGDKHDIKTDLFRPIYLQLTICNIVNQHSTEVISPLVTSPLLQSTLTWKYN